MGGHSSDPERGPGPSRELLLIWPQHHWRALHSILSLFQNYSILSFVSLPRTGTRTYLYHRFKAVPHRHETFLALRALIKVCLGLLPPALEGTYHISTHLHMLMRICV